MRFLYIRSLFRVSFVSNFFLFPPFHSLAAPCKAFPNCLLCEVNRFVSDQRDALRCGASKKAGIRHSRLERTSVVNGKWNRVVSSTNRINPLRICRIDAGQHLFASISSFSFYFSLIISTTIYFSFYLSQFTYYLVFFPCFLLSVFILF